MRARTELGSRWREVPLIVRFLMLPRTAATRTCDDCGATWSRSEGFGDDCKWCAARASTNHDYILKPPAPRRYGFATDEDLAALGYDRDGDRQRDLARWAQDLELAVGAGLITEEEARAAWASQTN